MKKILSVCLALCLAFTLAAPALAETVSLAPAALEAAPVTQAPAAEPAPEAEAPALTGSVDAAAPETADPAAQPAAGTAQAEKAAATTITGIVTDKVVGHFKLTSTSRNSRCVYEEYDPKYMPGYFELEIQRGDWEISMADDVTQTTRDFISVDARTTSADEWINLTIKDLNIDVAEQNNCFAFRVGTNTKVNLCLEGSSVLESGSGRSGLEIAHSTTGKSGLLIIDGEGSLEAIGGRRATGIGEGGYNCGSVTIRGGSITAQGGYGAAAIGAGEYGNYADITIEGGTLALTPGTDGHNIGKGSQASTQQVQVWLVDRQEQDVVYDASVIFEKDRTAGTVSGNYILQQDQQIPAGRTLTVPAGTSFTVAKENKLTVPAGAAIENNAAISLGQKSILRLECGLDGATGSGSLSLDTGAVVQLPLNEEMVTLSQDSFVADGSAQKPEVSIEPVRVWGQEITFTEGTDYTVTYPRYSSAVGDYTVTVTPKNSKFSRLFGNAVTLDYEITKPPVAEYTITASAGEGGTISPSGEVKVKAGESRTFTITPAEGYEIAGLTVDGAAVEPAATYTFENVETTHTIAATFAKVEEPEPEEPEDPGTPVVPDTSLTLDKDTLTLEPGDVEKLYATVKPSNATYKVVFWESSDPEIVAVNQSGVVMALADGEAVITATSWYGNTDTCTVTVKTPEPEPEPEPTPDPDEPNEEIKDFVRRCYLIALDREPEEEGYNNWTRWLADGTVDGKGCVYGFIFSKEMNNKDLSDADFIETLYWVLMDRPSDAEGKADWLAYLAAGHSRADVFAGFADSPEFIRLMDSYGVKHTSDITFPGL